VRGRIAMWNAEILGKAEGEAIRFHENNVGEK
jgi:hypothetical protein